MFVAQEPCMEICFARSHRSPFGCLFIVYIDRGVMQLIEVVPVAAGLA